jgi:hypothetical protein
MKSTDTYIPDLFRLPIHDISELSQLQRWRCALLIGAERGEVFTVILDFMEPLDFMAGKYHFLLPLSFPPGDMLGMPGAHRHLTCVGTFPPQLPVSQLVHIRLVINSITPTLRVGTMQTSARGAGPLAPLVGVTP